MTATRNPYERWYGHRYEQADNVKDVAAIVRKGLRSDLKDAAADPYHPLAGIAKVSVRYRTASMMQAVDVHVQYAEHTLHKLDPDCGWRETQGGSIDRSLYVCTECGSDQFRIIRGRIDRSAENAVQAAQAYIGAQLSAFNHDGSDSMTDYFDVRFYSTIGVRNPAREYDDEQTIPSVWARHLHTLVDRADEGDADAERRYEHDAMLALRARAGTR